MPTPDLIPVDIDMTMVIIARGAPLSNGLFTVSILDEQGVELHIAMNEESGLVVFSAVRFSEIGTFNYTTKITSASADWEIDPTEWPIRIDVIESNNVLHAAVTYPNGVPTFVNKCHSAVCKGPFEFPELVYKTSGTYEYTLKELTQSGDGWATDDRIVKVIVTVVDDGHGHLVAAVTYPDGFPTFKNYYHANPVRVVIHGCKLAVGAPLPAGKFMFGLFDKDGKQISSATNESHDDTDE